MRQTFDVFYQCINMSMGGTDFSHSIDGVDFSIKCVESGAKLLATTVASAALISATLF